MTTKKLAQPSDLVVRKGHPARRGEAGVIRSYLYLAFDYIDQENRPDLFQELAEAVTDELKMRGHIIEHHN